MENNDRVVNVSVEEGDMVDGFVPTVEHVETVSVAHEEVGLERLVQEDPAVPDYVQTNSVVKGESEIVSKGPAIEEEIDNEVIDGVLDYKFDKPFNFEGTEYEHVKFDFDSLTGRDIKEAVKALSAAEMSGLAETNKSFLGNLAAKSAGLPDEFMEYVKARDFSQITIALQGFLLN